jgi:hypothetical protein
MRRRSDALPDHIVCAAMMSRTLAATGSASITVSITALRLASGRPERGFAGGRPQGEIGHPWQSLQADGGQHVQAEARRLQQCPQDAGSRDFELAPDFLFRASCRFMDVGEGQKDRTIRQVRPRDDVLDAIENRGARGLKQHLIGVGVELADRKAAAACQSAQGIGGVSWNVGQVVEGEQVAKPCSPDTASSG